MSSSTLHQVVIVEDNVATNNLLQDWLKPHFAVTSFLDAESTLLKLPASDTPTTFVVDYNLPGKNGLEFLSEIKPQFPSGKYILISGLFDEKLLNAAHNAGYNATLPKPFAMPTLFKKIEELLDLKKSKPSAVKKVRKPKAKK